MHMNTFYYSWNKDKMNIEGSLKEREIFLKAERRQGWKEGIALCEIMC